MSPVRKVYTDAEARDHLQPEQAPTVVHDMENMFYQHAVGDTDLSVHYQGTLDRTPTPDRQATANKVPFLGYRVLNRFLKYGVQIFPTMNPSLMQMALVQEGCRFTSCTCLRWDSFIKCGAPP